MIDPWVWLYSTILFSFYQKHHLCHTNLRLLVKKKERMVLYNHTHWSITRKVSLVKGWKTIHDCKKSLSWGVVWPSVPRTSRHWTWYPRLDVWSSIPYLNPMEILLLHLLRPWSFSKWSELTLTSQLSNTWVQKFTIYITCLEHVKSESVHCNFPQTQTFPIQKWSASIWE